MSAAKLGNLELELKALKTVLTENNEHNEALFGVLRPEFFHYKVSKALFTRLQAVMEKNSSLPTWKMLITDSQLDDQIKEALEDQMERSPVAESKGDLEYVIRELNELANKRSLYGSIYETQESLYDVNKSSQDIAADVGAALLKIDNPDWQSEAVMGLGYNLESEKVYNDIIHNPEATNYIRTGFSSFDARSGGHQRGNLVVLGANSGGGKCTAGDSLCLTSKGQLPIGEIFNRLSRTQDYGWSELKEPLEVWTREGFKPVERLFKSRDSLLQMKTSWLDMVKATKEHKFLVWNGSDLVFSELGTLTVGTWIPKVFDLNKYGASEFDREDAEVCGLVVSEGNRDTAFSNLDQLLHTKIVKYASAKFDTELNHKNEIVTNFKGDFKSFISEHCGDVLSADRYVPKAVLEGSKPVQCSFIRYLFEGDGSVYLKNHGKQAKVEHIWVIELASLSWKLIYQVKAMLENMGILCSVREKRTWATNGSASQVAKTGYTLYINRVSALQFAEDIGFVSERKQEVLKEYCQHLTKIYNNELNQNSNAYACGLENQMPGNLVRDYLTRLLNICDSTEVEVTGTSHGKVTTYARTVGRWRLFVPNMSVKKFLEHGGDQVSKLLCDQILEAHKSERSYPELTNRIEKDATLSELRQKIALLRRETWARVESLEEVGGIHDVFDLSVEGKREYVCNGLLSHNSVFALNLMVRQYLLGYNVVMASYEMNKHEIFTRLLSIISEVDMELITLKKCSVAQKKKIDFAWREFNLKGIKNGNYYALETPTGETTISEVAYKYKSKNPTSIVYDYINLLTSKSKFAEAQWQVLGEIAKEGKIIASKLNVVVYLLAQINDQLELRYSKAIRDHANWFLGWLYDEDARANGFVTVKQLKARNAPCYDFQLLTRFDLSQFRDPDEVDKIISPSDDDLRNIIDESYVKGAIHNLFPTDKKIVIQNETIETIDLNSVKRQSPASSYYNAPDDIEEII